MARCRRWLACLLVGGLCAQSVTAESANAAQNRDAAARLKATVEQLNALDKWFTDAEQKRTRWLVDLQRQDRAIARIGTQVTAIHHALRDTQLALNDLQGQQARLDAQRRGQAAHIGRHISAAHRLNGGDFLKQLLNQESPDDLDRLLRYHRYFSESRLAVMAEYRATLDELAATDAQVRAKHDQQDQQRRDLEAEQAALSTERQARARLIAQLDSEKETKTEEYARLEQDRERLQTLIAELGRRASALDGTSFRKARGTLPMPVQGRVRHAFGARRADGRLRWHGIDIAAPHGAEVTAVFRGRVIFADWLRGFGFLTIVDHGSDYMTLYGHVDTLYKEVGDLVESGELIASAGNSGGNADPGLYFEVRHKGQPRDPIGWVKR